MLSVKCHHDDGLQSTGDLNADLHHEFVELRRKANECLNSSNRAEVLRLITKIERTLI